MLSRDIFQPLNLTISNSKWYEEEKMVFQTSVCESVERLCVRAHYNLMRAPDVEEVGFGGIEMVPE